MLRLFAASLLMLFAPAAFSSTVTGLTHITITGAGPHAFNSATLSTVHH